MEKGKVEIGSRERGYSEAGISRINHRDFVFAAESICTAVGQGMCSPFPRRLDRRGGSKLHRKLFT